MIEKSAERVTAGKKKMNPGMPSNTWFSSTVIHDGYILSLFLQLFIIVIPYSGWNYEEYPGLLDSYLDLSTVIISAVVIIICAGIIFFLRSLNSGERKFSRNITILLLLVNFFGLFHLLHALLVGFKSNLFLGGGIDTNSILGTVSHVGFVGLQFVACAYYFLHRNSNLFSRQAIGWAFVFLAIPFIAGSITLLFPIFPHPIFANALVTAIMYGCAAFFLDNDKVATFDAILVNSDLNGKPRDLGIIELKGMNVPGVLFLVGLLVFNISSFTFIPSEIISTWFSFFIIIVIMTALSFQGLGRWITMDSFKFQLYIGLLFCMGATLNTFLVPESGYIAWGLLESLLVGGSLGAVIAPVGNSIRKIIIQERSLIKIITLAALMALISMFFMFLSAVFQSNRQVVTDYGADPYVLAIIISLAATPMVMLLNYSVKLKIGSRKPVTWIIQGVALISIFTFITLVARAILIQVI
ncbi:hypothetical protein GF325_18030 [Candidatus Bathyarchaeota archaeon]|nr:hypothetical protein [Candidatus Bathyarchaeota archaeon]